MCLTPQKPTRASTGNPLSKPDQSQYWRGEGNAHRKEAKGRASEDRSKSATLGPVPSGKERMKKRGQRKTLAICVGLKEQHQMSPSTAQGLCTSSWHFSCFFRNHVSQKNEDKLESFRCQTSDAWEIRLLCKSYYNYFCSQHAFKVTSALPLPLPHF